MKLIRTVATISGFTGISRVTGLCREILLSHVLGAGVVVDAFVVAFKFPNFFRRLFAEGALHAAFVPTFSKILVNQGFDAAREVAERVFAVLAAVLSGLVIFVLLFTPEIIPFLAPGFASTPERMQLAVDFTRLTFPYILFISLAALLTGVLNSLDRFAAGAAAPIILNVVMIIMLLSYAFIDMTPGYALAVGVLIAGILQFLWLYVRAWRSGMHLHFRFPRLTPDVRRVIGLMIPGAVGAGVMQINLLVDMFLASLLPTGSISYLYYADRLNQLPLSIFGIAIGTALLPQLSKLIHAGKQEQAQHTQEVAVQIALQMSLPSMVGLMVLAHPVIALIYGHGHFGAREIAATAPALAAFAVGLPAYVLCKVFTASFFARHDTKTPVRFAMVAVSINIALNLLLMNIWQHVGMALATSLASWVHVGLLAYSLNKRGFFHIPASLVKQIGLLLITTAFMAAGLLGLKALFAAPGSIWHEIFNVLLLTLLGIGLYLICGHLLRALHMKDMKKLLSIS